MKLSIVIPAYNEEARLGTMLGAYLPWFVGKYGHDVEAIVAVNGSKDGTEAVARSFAADYPQLKVLVEPNAIGKGAAIMMGGQLAQGDYIGFVDADGATPPEAFDELLEKMGEADLIIASRRLPGAVVNPPQPWKRRFVSRVFNAMVRALFRLSITDTQCGAKLMTAPAWKTVVPKIGITRWAFDVDLLFQTRRARLKIREIPTVWHDVAGSRLRIAPVSMQMLLAIVRLRLVYSPLAWVVRAYDRLLGRVIDLPAYTE